VVGLASLGLIVIATAMTAPLGRADEGPPRVKAKAKALRAESVGTGPRSYRIFEPLEKPDGPAPVVLFLHGWLAVNPGVYGAWIEHLVNRGAIVVFPRYQDGWLTPPEQFLPNTLAAARDAFDVLETGENHARPDRTRFAVIGHSAGGNLALLFAAAVAARPEEERLPRPRAVVCVQPGEVRPVDGPDLARVPADTRLAVAVGDLDIVVGDGRARGLFAAASAKVPPENRLYVLYRTDRSGPFPLIADHLAPTGSTPGLDTGDGPFRGFQITMARVDVLDRFGFWRLADLTMAAAFADRSLADVTRDGDAIRDLGHWGDGRPVRPPVVATDAAAVPRVLPGRGLRLFSRRLADEPARVDAQSDPDR
jgi:dienelactone hydrolase